MSPTPPDQSARPAEALMREIEASFAENGHVLIDIEEWTDVCAAIRATASAPVQVPPELRELSAEATDGLWMADRNLPINRKPRLYGGSQTTLIAEFGNVVVDQDRWEADASLAAAAVNHLRAQIAAEDARATATQPQALTNTSVERNL